ncbi:hypothetical protein GCM10029978_042480 [Actinoallomurus acanthiterrae]
MRSAKLFALSPIVTTTLIATAAPSALGATTASARSGDVAPPNCKKYSVRETYSIDAAGRRSAAQSDSGKVRVFGGGANGMKVVVPPAGFDPHAATDSQLRLYGFPPRPASGPARERWNRLYPHRHIDYVTPEMCSNTGVTAGPPSTSRAGGTALASVPLTSPRWSGGLAIRATGSPAFTAAFVQWNEPTFVAACPTQSSYNIWSGLGGWTSGESKWGLLQVGVDNLGGTGPNDDYVWWEALNQSKTQTLPEQVVTNMKVSAGNKVQAMTYYDPIGHTIAFQVYNLSTNKLVTLGPWSIIKDQNGIPLGTADDYYDGTYAETIAERSQVNDKNVNLRQPSSKYSQFLDTEIANDQDGDVVPGYQYPNWNQVNMSDDAGGNLLSVPANFPTSGSPAWKNTWKACS